ncbi:single-strand DNA endonuclease 1 isoform X2 [Jatropha curcas]|uniref:single-strand DNA endonuclease 1 isoform X2 n=1 Tax=Jatropha curcas TaxID=180498 RepID=UPI0009D68A04|nr:single-strand DNA endonuclease 1 isoform X2 [Jatropha curcas]
MPIVFTPVDAVVTQDETNSTKACSLRRNMGSAFSRMIKEAKALGLALGIPCLDGIEEAEAQCALLNSESLCDGCFTSDSDVFLFGARTVYRDICLGKGGHVVCYEMADIEKKLGFGRNSLITLALLLGSDYSEGIHGLGPESACQIVKSVGDNNVLQRIASEGLSFAKKAKNSKKRTQPNSLHPEFNVNGREENIDEPNQFLQVIDAYLKPKCHSADSDVVYRVLVQLPFQRVTLQQICAQFFAWPPEKTDEYILPKIAEGDLRRFANLRRTSSELGVRPPPDKIPVKCPVSGIVKRRKAQGRECFEVLWEGLDGLETSIVPVDLIDSACPEKIAEFEERRAMGKKQNHQNRNPRTKKSRNRSAAAEVDLRLQTLLLDIESGSSTTSSDSFPSKEMISEEYSTTATAGHPHMVESQQSVTDSNAALPPSDTDPSLAKYEIIDLLSPSPPVRARKVSRFQRVGKQCIELIDSSESETEASPEHVRKARELRLFLASIKDDIS